MDSEEDPFLVIDIIALLMPGAIEMAWQRMREQVAQERRHSQTIRERHRQTSSSETLSALQAMREKNRELAQSAIENRNELARMLSSHEAICERLDQKAKKAAKRSDTDLAMDLRRERDSHQKTLALTRASLEQAEALLEQIQQALARAEEQLRQEERLLNIERR